MRFLTRRKFFRITASVCGALVAGGGIYSALVEPWWLESNEITVRIPDLPPPLDGLKLLHLSDLHCGKLVSFDYIRSCAKTAAAFRPDIVCITGDFVTHEASYITQCLDALSILEPPLGIFAVPGNHDYWAGSDHIFSEIKKAGIHLLINEAETIERGGARLWIIGLDDLWEGQPDINAAMANLRDERTPDNKPKMLLMHNPDMIEDIAHLGFQLILAGHTHGGQVRLPFLGPLIVPSEFGAKYAAGMFNVERSLMYVSKGVGVVVVPFRFLTRPEITCFTLTSQ